MKTLTMGSVEMWIRHLRDSKIADFHRAFKYDSRQRGQEKTVQQMDATVIQQCEKYILLAIANIIRNNLKKRVYEILRNF